jgi:hypothetical protein
MLTCYEADSRAGCRGRGDTVTDTVDTVIGSRGRLRIPSRGPSNPCVRVADETIAGFIAEGDTDGPSNALRGDGRDVGIGSIFGPRSSVLAHERRPPVDNRVGVSLNGSSLTKGGDNNDWQNEVDAHGRCS